MANCTRCERTTTLLVECEECHEQFCESHRTPRDHDCRALSTDDSTDGGSGADTPEDDRAEPTVLYPEEIRGNSTDGETSEDADGGRPARMDLDPTLEIGRLLRTGGVVVAVLVVGLAAAGFLWMGPGVGVSSDAGTGGPGGVSPADGSAAAASFDTSRAERLIHEFTNRERREAGVSSIEYDEDLAAIAEYHSHDMGESGYVSHTSPGGETIADRYRKFDYACGTTGEVIQWVDYGDLDGSGAEALARTVVENWMDSDLHRSFVTNESWERQGVGVYLADSGRVYVTQNTCSGS